MKKATFITTLQKFAEQCNIPLSELHVSHGGSLLMLGLKDHTNDIDVTVKEEVFEFFDKALPASSKIPLVNNRHLITVSQDIDIHLAEDAAAWDNLEVDESGIHYRGVDRTIYDYETLGRPTDKQKLDKLMKLKADSNLAPIQVIPMKIIEALAAEAKVKNLSIDDYVLEIINARNTNQKFEEFMTQQIEFNKKLLEALNTSKDTSKNTFDVETEVIDCFSTRAATKLNAEGIQTVNDLINYDLDILCRVPGVGPRALVEIESFLIKHGFISEPLKRL